MKSVDISSRNASNLKTFRCNNQKNIIRTPTAKLEDIDILLLIQMEFTGFMKVFIFICFAPVVVSNRVTTQFFNKNQFFDKNRKNITEFHNGTNWMKT